MSRMADRAGLTSFTHADGVQIISEIYLKHCVLCCFVLVCPMQEVLGNCGFQPTTAAGTGIPASRRRRSPFQIDLPGFEDIQRQIDDFFNRASGGTGRKLLRDQGHRMR